MLMSDDMVGEWVKKGQNHDDVILEWSLRRVCGNSKVYSGTWQTSNWMKYLNDYLMLITLDLIEMPNLSSIAIKLVHH